MVLRGRRAVVPVVGAALVAGALALAVPPAEAATTTVTVTASADTYADASNPTRNYGSSSSLLSRGTPGGVTWLRFALPTFPAGSTLTGAVLRLRTTSSSSSGSAASHTVRTGSSGWTEGGLTWNNQPANTGTALGTLSGATSSSTTYSTALATAPLAGLSATSLNLTVSSTGTDGLYVTARSSNSSSSRPALILTFTTTSSTDTTAPSPPTAVVATVSAGTVGLTWTASTDDTGVTAYDVHRSSSQGFTAEATNQIGSTATTSFTDPGRPAGTWFYRLVARDAAGNKSAASTAVAAVVPDTTAPTAPTALAASTSPGGTALTWTASTDDVGVTAYDVHRSGVSGFTPSASTLLASTAATSWTDTAPPAGTVYYVVVARDAAANQSPPSTQVQGPVVGGPADTAPPSEVQGLAVSAPGTSPVLSWQAATDDTGVTAYALHRATDPAFTPSATTLVGTTTALSLGDPSVPGGSWHYRVVARDAAGNSSVSAPLAVSITAGSGATTTIEPIADTYGNAGAPTSNFGTSASLNSRGSIGATSWLRYVLPAPGTAPLATATLRFRTNTDTTAGSLDAHTVAIANDTWTETGLTWNNQPALGGPVLGQITGATAVNTAYSAGLDAAALTSRLGQQISISISSTGTDSLWFWSRNYGTTTARPVLVLTWPASVVAAAPPPGPPTGLTATPGAGTVHLEWTAPSATGIASYDVERSADPTFPTGATLRIAGITTTSYDDRNLAVGGYWYRVTAVDTAGARGTASSGVPVSVTDGAPPDVRVFAVGDLVCTPGTATTSSTCRHADVAAAVAASGADWFMPLGDIQYQYGLFTDFVAPGGYDQSFGQFLPRTLPVIGNHEYADSTGAGNGYFQYFDPTGTGQFGAKPAAYYTRTIGTWRLIVLNSECSVGIENAQHMLAGGCAPGSPEYTWLQQVLQSSTERCTIAAFHRPRWSSQTASTNPASYPEMAPLWDLLAQYGVELGLSGHKHGSEVFPPIGVSGSGEPVADPNGVVQFVAGAGGKDLGPFDPLTTAAGRLVIARDNTTFGGLSLTLHDGSYDWAFTPVAGMTFKNSGTTGAFSGTGVSCR